MEIPRSYRKPLLIAVFLHIFLAVILIIQLPHWSYRNPGHAGHPVKIVQAQAVDQAQVQHAMREIEDRELAKQRAEEQRLHQLHLQAQKAIQARQREAKRVASMRRQQLQLKALHLKQLVALKAIQHQAVLEKQKVAAAKKQALVEQKKIASAKQKALHEAKLAELRRQQEAAKARAKRLLAQAQALQQKMLAQQLAGEHQALSKMQAAQEKGIVDKYKALITQAIEQQWLIPTGVNKQLKSEFVVQVAPGGVVISVSLLHSSGNHALDHSAETAIYKASPLPVPKDPVAFDHFRRLHLTVSPKEVISTQA